MKKRRLTLLIELDEYQNTSWIWTSHKSHEFINGIKVSMICEGCAITDIEDDIYKDINDES